MSSSSYLSGQISLPNPALRLVLSQLVGIPLGFWYRKLFYNQRPAKQQWFFAVTGFCLFLLNYGWSTIHSMISVFVAYVLCNLAAGTLFSVAFAYIFFMSYLIAGYYQHSSEVYDLSWTMPQCVLTLRLIGLILDIYDGAQPESNLSEYQKKAAIRVKPSLLEISAYAYFYGSSFVGPQYPLNRLRQLMNGEFSKPGTKEPPDSVKPAFGRLLAGIAFALGHLYYHARWPTEFCLTDEFARYSIWQRSAYIIVWFRFIIMRYQAVWLIAEGVCILTGLGHNVDPTSGEQLWDGVRNFRLTKFELSATFQGIIESFNYNTNQWAFHYCFKRLRFLGNKNASHVLTLAFLALWHGTDSGYFVCFLFEYVCVIAERQLKYVLRKETSLQRLLSAPVVSVVSWFVQKLFVLYCCAFGFLPFSLLIIGKWWKVYSRLYFLGWIVLSVLWPLTFYWYKRRNRRIRREKRDQLVEPTNTMHWNGVVPKED
uniref:Lysophospholipid acyltransferase 5 n=1 Tax=Trichuris muris TaxID=70415 RepID=A0A5S6QDF0_TRIMR